jgi:hypothetical protein
MVEVAQKHQETRMHLRPFAPAQQRSSSSWHKSEAFASKNILRVVEVWEMRVARLLERKKERPTPVARRALRGPLQARATEGCKAFRTLSGPSGRDPSCFTRPDPLRSSKKIEIPYAHYLNIARLGL